jgi:hypothetical protein
MARKAGYRVARLMNNPASAVIRDKDANYLDSGKPVEYQGLASRGFTCYTITER